MDPHIYTNDQLKALVVKWHKSSIYVPTAVKYVPSQYQFQSLLTKNVARSSLIKIAIIILVAHECLFYKLLAASPITKLTEGLCDVIMECNYKSSSQLSDFLE